ncbi:FAD-dependent monooxygenase [Streptomyces albus]|uniref:FAD-dependent monooxygenase n=1 Tax=Streptomyces albus TaxID=1888 RepID=UPI0033D0C8CF
MTEVLIVGAGPTGLTLACDLRRRGIGVRVAERGPALFPGSRGKGIQPRTLEVLDDLGVADAALAAGGPYPPMLVRRPGQPPAEHDLVERAAPGAGTPYPQPLMLPQWRTQQLLHERLRALGGEVEFETALTGLEQDAAGVTAHLSTGRTVRAAYVVACDGGRSTVRGALGIAMHGETVDPEPFVVADVRIAGLERTHWHVWSDEERGMLALCPLAGTDAFQLVARPATLEGTEGAEGTEGGEGSVRRTLGALLAARTGLEAGRLEEVLYSSQFRVNAAMADRFRDGRVFLAGDAAHIHSPAGGQGLNTGVQDAYNLGWKLGLVLRGQAAEGLLDSYETERAPLAAGVLGLSTRLHGGAARRGPETHQLELGYPDSPLTRRPASTAPGGVAPGDRAPDAHLPAHTPGRVFELLRGPHATLLAVGGATPPADLPSYVRTHAIPPADAYAAGGLYLIRPDGYVALATGEAEEVRAYLTGLSRDGGCQLRVDAA